MYPPPRNISRPCWNDGVGREVRDATRVVRETEAGIESVVFCLVETVTEIFTWVKISQVSVMHIDYIQNSLKQFQKEMSSQNLIVPMINFSVLDATLHAEAILLYQWSNMKRE